MTQAKAWFSCLGAKNTWKRDVLTVDVKKMTITGKPKVLARVSRNGRRFVGSSVILKELAFWARVDAKRPIQWRIQGSGSPLSDVTLVETRVALCH